MLIEKNELIDIIMGNEQFTKWQKEEIIECIGCCEMYDSNKQPNKYLKWNNINIEPITYERLIVLCLDGFIKFSRYYKGMFFDIEANDNIKDKSIKNVVKWITLQSFLDVIKKGE